MLNSTAHRISTTHRSLKRWKISVFLAFKSSNYVFIPLINVKMPTIVGILTFMSRIIFVLSSVEHGKSFITSVPDVCQHGRMREALGHNNAISSWNISCEDPFCPYAEPENSVRFGILKTFFSHRRISQRSLEKDPIAYRRGLNFRTHISKETFATCDLLGGQDPPPPSGSDHFVMQMIERSKHIVI